MTHAICWRWPALAAIAIAIAIAIAGVGVSYPATRAFAAAPPPARQPIVALAAQQVGIRRCLPAITSIAQRATSGAQSQDVVIDWDHVSPDTAPFFSLTGMGSGTEHAALTITAIPTANGGCAILVERIASGAQTCREVAATQLPPVTGGVLIEGINVYQNPKLPEETFTLIQNAGGCVVIRRQATFEWRPKR